MRCSIKMIAVLAALAACGGPPVLHNAPRPNPAAVAGAAALVAGAATVADPQAAAHRQDEANKEGVPPPPPGGGSGALVPEDVLDRLDAQQDAGVTPP